MRFRKKDYIIVYIIIIIMYGIQLVSPVKTSSILALFIGAIFPALTIGTITNFLFSKR